MKRLALLAIIAILFSCAENKNADSKKQDSPIVKERVNVPPISGPLELVTFEELDLDPGNDSLWYHLVIDIPGQQHLAIAQATAETNRNGIRMQLLTMNADSTFSCNAESSPGYDSSKMFPTFYQNKTGQLLILCDTGERDSWGQKIYLLDNGRFYDIGFIDAGTVHYTENSDSGEMELSPKTIASNVKISHDFDGIRFDFDTEEFILFDDGHDNLNQQVKGKDWRYTYSNDGQWTLTSLSSQADS